MTYRPSKKINSVQRAHIEALSHDGRGIARVEGKAVFVEEALPGEEVDFRYIKTRRHFDEGVIHQLITPSKDRVTPACEHYKMCGGCRLQHLDSNAQIHYKQNNLLANLKKIGHVEPQSILEPMTGPVLNYRSKARLGVKFVQKKAKVLIGFREKQGKYQADLSSCKVLHASVGERLNEFSRVLGELSIYDKIPQVECAVGHDETAIVIRILSALTPQDEQKLIEFAKQNRYQIYVQPKGPDSLQLLYPNSAQLYYLLSDFNVKIEFSPLGFTQINPDINRQLIKRAIELLELNHDDSVLDLFCGAGNFSLPLAKYAGKVTGVEGDVGLIQNAKSNAKLNAIENVQFYSTDLMQATQNESWWDCEFNKILLDPPRSGAIEIIKQLHKFKANRLLYVSCNTATLSRDAAVLVHEQGYKLLSAGILDMFPHTAHVESIALFER